MPGQPTILRASVTGAGVLTSADPPILLLQQDAGGALGEVLAVPQLAAMARLAGRLAITISRPVLAAGRECDIDMWVRARPQPDGGADLSIIDWQERPSLVLPGDGTARAADLVALDSGWTWQIDPQMRFALLAAGDAPDDALPDLPPAIGNGFTSYFTILAEPDGDIPILNALAQRRAFAGQRAALSGEGARIFMLSGYPLFDTAGRFDGYRGKAKALDDIIAPTNAIPPAASYPAEFGRRLDRSLRQPLGRIIANADTISAQLEGPLRPDYAGYATDIAAAGRHLMALIDDLADLQAIDRPDFAVEAEDLDLADVARRAAGLLSVKALDRNIRIDPPRLDETMPAIGEFRRVLQILVNLIGNAVRYSPEGSQVWVRIDQDGGVARVTVADQGPGIEIDAKERIFEKFERLGREEAGGSGLGLYISRRLARAMGGEIAVDSAPGQGARFTLSLPITG